MPCPKKQLSESCHHKMTSTFSQASVNKTALTMKLKSLFVVSRDWFDLKQGEKRYYSNCNNWHESLKPKTASDKTQGENLTHYKTEADRKKWHFVVMSDWIKTQKSQLRNLNCSHQKKRPILGWTRATNITSHPGQASRLENLNGAHTRKLKKSLILMLVKHRLKQLTHLLWSHKGRRTQVELSQVATCTALFWADAELLAANTAQSAYLSQPNALKCWALYDDS